MLEKFENVKKYDNAQIFMKAVESEINPIKDKYIDIEKENFNLNNEINSLKNDLEY